MDLGISGKQTIGHGAALALAREGCEVFISARNEERLNTAAAEMATATGIPHPGASLGTGGSQMCAPLLNRSSFNENTNAEIYGAELELVWAPNENWLLNGNFAYLKTEVQDLQSVDTRDPTGGRDDVTLIKDATLANLRSADGSWYVRAYVKNIVDDDHLVGQYLTDATSGLFSNVFAIEPRTYGIALGYNFN